MTSAMSLSPSASSVLSPSASSASASSTASATASASAGHVIKFLVNFDAMTLRATHVANNVIKINELMKLERVTHSLDENVKWWSSYLDFSTGESASASMVLLRCIKQMFIGVEIDELESDYPALALKVDAKKITVSQPLIAMGCTIDEIHVGSSSCKWLSLPLTHKHNSMDAPLITH